VGLPQTGQLAAPGGSFDPQEVQFIEFPPEIEQNVSKNNAALLYHALFHIPRGKCNNINQYLHRLCPVIFLCCTSSGR
jgi:hypothetical protein